MMTHQQISKRLAAAIQTVATPYGTLIMKEKGSGSDGIITHLTGADHVGRRYTVWCGQNNENNVLSDAIP